MQSLLKFIFTFLVANIAFGQIEVTPSSLKAKQLSSTGFSIYPEVSKASSVNVRFLPIKNTTDTLYFSSNNSSKKHHIQLDGLAPSQFYKAEFIFYNEKDTLKIEKYYVTSSSSSGKILAYFNHEVQTNLATFSEANAVDNALRDTLINYINRAEETIDVAIYNSFGNNPTTLIAGALNQAHLDGKRVRVIYDGSTSSTMINVLNSSIGLLERPETEEQPGIMHHKFMIIDAEHSDPTKALVWTGGTNWTTGQINGPSKNNVTIVQDQSLAQTYQIEFEEMWGGSGNFPNFNNVKFGNLKTDNTPKEFVVDGVDIECYFSPTDGTEAQILDLINAAEESLVIATMLITRQNLAQAVINKFNENIAELAFLIDTENYSGQQKEFLAQNLSDEVYKEYGGDGIMHHKMMVVDHGTPNAVVLNGSHNWSFSAENRNDENTLIIYDEDLANQYYQAIAFMFSESGGILSVEEFDDLNLRIFPNPATSYVEISLSDFSTLKEVRIFSTQGNLVLNEKLNSTNRERISVEDLSSGVYLLQLITTDNKIINHQLIKK